MKHGSKVILAFTIFAALPSARAQSLVTTVAPGPNQIEQIKTAQGITTRITFPETVRDIVCGDLYDPATGKGSFVVQRIDNDVFLKPVVPKGMSNLFVKTGEAGQQTYAFDLQIVPLDQSHRVVNVTRPQAPAADGSSAGDRMEDSRKTIAAAQRQADDLLRSARQQADGILTKANQQASDLYGKALQRSEDLDRMSAKRAEQQVEDRFIRAMIQGVREIKSVDSRIAAKRIAISLDPRVLTFDEKSYLRYTIRNNGDAEFSFAGLALERRSGKSAFVIPARVVQGTAQNKLGPGAALMGIIVFDAKEVGTEDKLVLSVRGEGNTEIARLNIQ